MFAYNNYMMHNFLITLNSYSVLMKVKRIERLNCSTSLENHCRREVGKKARQSPWRMKGCAGNFMLERDLFFSVLKIKWHQRAFI